MEEAAPAWATETPQLRESDSRWIALADRQCDRLTDLLRPWLAASIEHVGSTAIPGLAAKPIVDLAASVTDPDLVVDWAGDALAAAGWHFVPPKLDRRPWRRFFVNPDPTGHHRRAHLHLLRVGEPRWREQLIFRDELRRDPELVQRYAALKYRLADQHPNDREAYTSGKSDFVATVLAAAGGRG